MKIPDIIVQITIALIGFLLILTLNNIKWNQERIEKHLEKRIEKIEDFLFFDRKN